MEILLGVLVGVAVGLVARMVLMNVEDQGMRLIIGILSALLSFTIIMAIL